jgi:A/G-specific adenine glycosylase
MEELVDHSNKNIKQFQNFILNWAVDNLKIYPWREKRTPYKILISEYFLTRTKAHQVEPIYIKFIKKYPSLESFLELETKIIKNIMNSLGLHKRVEMLKKLSEQLQQNYDKKIPDNFKDLKSLMGIGKYSANAILCFGFNYKRPLLDANFIRLYKRVFNVTSKTKTPKTDKYLWEFSKKLLPEKDYVNFNYGILDFCIEICTPKNPKCEDCPLNQMCKYYNSMN